MSTLEKLVPLISELADTNPEIPITADIDDCKTVGDIVNLIDKELAKC